MASVDLTETQRQESLAEMLMARTLGTPIGGLIPLPNVDIARGLQVYQANAHASALRALESVFPVLQQLLGPESFAGLSRAYWHESPPARGDLAWLGAQLAMYLEGQPHLLEETPYLADLARLEFALAQAETAHDAELDATSLQLLAELDPKYLRLQLMPSVAVLNSRFPVLSIWQAHQVTEFEHADRFADARTKLLAREGEGILVFRLGWRAQAQLVSSAECNWLQALMGGTNLALALDVAGSAFDFQAWLAEALRLGWLMGASRVG